MVNEIRHEKDYFLREMRLIAYNGRDYDISPLRGVLRFYEDIFGSPMTGELQVTDTMDLATLFPFIGEEVLRVIFTKQDPNAIGGGFLEDVVLEFDIYKVTGRTVLQTKTQNYVFHLISRESTNANKTKIFESWKHTTYGEMARQVYNTYVRHNKEIFIEPTLGEKNFCVGNKSPFEAINMFAARSFPLGTTRGKQHQPPVLFYEDRERFNFVSVDSLLLQEPSEIYIRKIANLRNATTFSKEIEENIRRMEFIDWVGWYDNMRLLDMGFYGQEFITVNPIERRYEKREFRISQDWDRMNRLERERVFSENSVLADSTLSHRKVVFTNENIESWNSDERSSDVESVMMDRTAKLAQLFYTRFAMSASGDPRRRIGQVIKLELPEEAGDITTEKNEEYNRYYYGNYLITALKHEISFTTYTMDMELARDGFWQPIEHEDPFERYREVL